jgi:hypothetical protein
MTEKKRKILTINLIILLILNFTYGGLGILASFGIVKESLMHLAFYLAMFFTFIVILQIWKWK